MKLYYGTTQQEQAIKRHGFSQEQAIQRHGFSQEQEIQRHGFSIRKKAQTPFLDRSRGRSRTDSRSRDARSQPAENKKKYLKRIKFKPKISQVLFVLFTCPVFEKK